MPSRDLTLLLDRARDGDRAALELFYREVDAELRVIAAARLRGERAGHLLQPTALVNEAYLRLLPAEQQWQNRRHFFAAAAESMRRVLVDHARRLAAAKRGGELARVTLSEFIAAPDVPDDDVLAVDDALQELQREEPALAELVKLRFFAGLGVEEIATALEVSPSTVKRDWAYARAWLLSRLRPA